MGCGMAYTLISVMVEAQGAGIEEGTFCEAVQMGLTSVSAAHI